MVYVTVITYQVISYKVQCPTCRRPRFLRPITDRSLCVIIELVRNKE